MKKIKKIKNSLGFGQIALSFLFLFNPNISIIDPLPDIIGYLILCQGLVKLADLNETISLARSLFVRMIFVDAVKLVSVLAVFGLSFGDEQNTMLLLIAFVLGIIELYTLIPAYKHLFSGLHQLGFKYDNTSIMGRAQRSKKKNFTEKASGYTAFYIVLKVAMYILPEFSVLATQASETAADRVTIYDFVGLLRSTAVLICTVFGVIWLVKMISYFTRVKKDEPLIRSLSSEYGEAILPKESLFLQRKIKGAFFLLGAFALLGLDMRLDGVNVIPDVVSALMLGIAILLVKKYIKDHKKYLCFTALYAAAALASDIAEYAFFNKYYYGAVIRNDGAYRLYCVMLSLSVVETVAFIGAVFVLICVFRQVIHNYTGFSVKEAEKSSEGRIKALHDELSKKLYFVWGAAILAAASDVFYAFRARTLGFAGLINGVCTVILFIAVYYAATEIFDEVRSKYMLD